MRPGFWSYLRAAFNARPFGLLVPPNWIGVAAFGLLGVLNPGFWVIGAGLEVGYLVTLLSSERFRRTVTAIHGVARARDWQSRLDDSLRSLNDPDRRRYLALAARCRSILGQQPDAVAGNLGGGDQGLARLTWLYLRLLLTRQVILRVVPAGHGGTARDGEDAELERRLKDLRARLADQSLDDDLRRSLTGQAEILEQRRTQRAEARSKLDFVDAELTRIEEQVELMREQTALTDDPESLSHRIDAVAATLGGTTQWLKEQQQLYGQTDALLDEAPPLAVQARVPQRQ